MDPFGAGAALHRLVPPGHISSPHRAGKDGARVWMNQEEENKETKKGRRKKKTGNKVH